MSTATDNGGVFTPTNIFSTSYDGTKVVGFTNPLLGGVSNQHNEVQFYAGVLQPNQTRDESLDNVYIPGPHRDVCCTVPMPEHHPTTPEHVTPEPATGIMLLAGLVATLVLIPVSRRAR